MSLFYRIIDYIKFLYKSKNEHGVHSPFVFNLVTKCLYDKEVPDNFKKWENYQKELYANKEFISVTDFGAGSKVFKSNKRQISQIAKHAGISKKRALLLMKLVNYFQFENVLEIGTSLGLASSAMSYGKEAAKITTLEGCIETAATTKKMFDRYELSNIKVIEGEFGSTLESCLTNSTYDLIYFDGNHSKDATLQYFEQCLRATHNDTLFLFDDIHWSKEMQVAWECIQQHEKVTVSIDTYQWGLVFFRKEQQKEHFTIRV